MDRLAKEPPLSFVRYITSGISPPASEKPIAAYHRFGDVIVAHFNEIS